ncbi:MAG: MltA domain-containing protein, partial [Acidobacteriota bacterium]
MLLPRSSGLQRAALLLLLLLLLHTTGACAGPGEPPGAAGSGLLTGAAASEGQAPAAPTAPNALRPVPRSQLPLLIDEAAGDGDWSSLRIALERQRRWLRNRPADRLYTFGPRQLRTTELRDAVDLLLGWLESDPSPETFGARVARHFDLYESVGHDGRGTMLVTGYFVPAIRASLTRRPGYEVPIYGPPSGGSRLVRVDLGAFSDEWRGRRIAGLLEGGRLIPFPDRREIRTGSRMRGREIAWAADPVDLFFVEVQGSGVLSLEGGGERRIGYAGANGRPYRSIGKLLIDRGKVPRERMSMQAIRAYLDENPEELHDVLDYNPSFVFFRFLEGPPVGNLGFPVTAGRSIAVDQKLMPRGGVGFLITEKPNAAEGGATVIDGEIRRFVVAQDTGGA